MKNSPNAAEKEQLLRTLPILAKLVSLFCQYGDFDRLRQTSPDARLHIDAISQARLAVYLKGGNVGSAVIQRYLDSIIDAALISESTGALLGPALDAIAYTVKQGLAHPMQCLPALVALETSPNSAVYKKAFALHSSLHSKHSTLVNTRIAESVQAAFQYQYRNQEEANVCGCHGDPPIAKLTLWYTLMKEKRQWRLDFLKAFMRGLHIEIADKKHCEQAKVAFARFTAENLSAFEYKSQEEIFFVVKECTSLLSVAGMSLLRAQYHRLQEPDEQENDIRDLAKSSVVLSFSLCLRAHLRQLYGITDQKLAKHAPGKKSAAGDKAPIVKASARTVMDYFGLPFIDRPVTTNEDAAKQIKAYVDLIDADETIREMGDDEDERRSDN
ncbi:Sister chromatid cohesion protein 2 [Cystobasidiomycetes sp. EMM_F5]